MVRKKRAKKQPITQYDHKDKRRANNPPVGLVAANTEPGKLRKFLLMLMPSSTVFVSSACIMILELVGGRLVARDVGSSLYTWTSIIGVVLLGISVGNYVGGRIADRFPSRKTLSLLFGLCSAACILIVIFNNFVSTLAWLYKLDWPVHVFVHICLVFLLPSLLLGTISPIVAKRALQHGLATGRTIGDLYAWGAIGSIAGTFITGFYLIAKFGTIATIWGVGVVLLMMCILYWPKSWVTYLWAVAFLVLMIVGRADAKWAQRVNSMLMLRKERNPEILYETESQYSYISVRQLTDIPDIRSISLNNDFARNRIVMDNIRDLRDPYMRIYAAVTSRLSQNKRELSVLAIGGGGYVYPRYVEDVWPGSRIDVVEIDPAVTQAAMVALGLSRDTKINIITMDARNYVSELLEKEVRGEEIGRYDFVYGDAFNDFAVPYQLVTRQFNDQIARVLTDDGIYMLNIIDMYDSGRFLGALVNTIQETFPTFYVASLHTSHRRSNSFVIIAGKRHFVLDGLSQDTMLKQYRLEILNASQIEDLARKSQSIVLTDDYAPVENLLSPAVISAFENSRPTASFHRHPLGPRGRSQR